MVLFWSLWLLKVSRSLFLPRSSSAISFVVLFPFYSTVVIGVGCIVIMDHSMGCPSKSLFLLFSSDHHSTISNPWCLLSSTFHRMSHFTQLHTFVQLVLLRVPVSFLLFSLDCHSRISNPQRPLSSALHPLVQTLGTVAGCPSKSPFFSSDPPWVHVWLHLGTHTNPSTHGCRSSPTSVPEQS